MYSFSKFTYLYAHICKHINTYLAFKSFSGEFCEPKEIKNY